MPGIELYPKNSQINRYGHLEIGGCDVVDLVNEHGTPLYIYDDEHLRSRAKEIREAFQARWANALILYATKAYYSPYLARIYKEAGLGIDVTSEGEMEIARRVGLPPDRIYLHGNNKTPAEIRAALAMGVEHIVVDNLDEIELLAGIAGEMSVVPQVLLRLTPAVDPHTHRHMATGIAESKFGLSMVSHAPSPQGQPSSLTDNPERNFAEADAMRAARRIMDLQLNLVGLHMHIGSQISEIGPYRDALAIVTDFAQALQKAFGFQLQELDLGGGWGVAYTRNQQTLAVETVAQAITEALGAHRVYQATRLLFEPGRALIAQSAVALYTVGSVKEIHGLRTYVSVDGGIGDNVRPALYGAEYSACAANRMNDTSDTRVAIAGRYCEQGDILIDQVMLPRVAVGDLIAIPCAGAYQIPMASNYNLIPRPAVISVREGEARVIRRRETILDMLRYEIEE